MMNTAADNTKMSTVPKESFSIAPPEVLDHENEGYSRSFLLSSTRRRISRILCSPPASAWGVCTCRAIHMSLGVLMIGTYLVMTSSTPRSPSLHRLPVSSTTATRPSSSHLKHRLPPRGAQQKGDPLFTCPSSSTTHHNTQHHHQEGRFYIGHDDEQSSSYRNRIFDTGYDKGRTTMQALDSMPMTPYGSKTTTATAKNSATSLTYERYKQAVYHTKADVYGRSLHSGDAVYVTAGGTLDFFATLQIASQTHGVQDVHVYGHESDPAIVDWAQRLWQDPDVSAAAGRAVYGNVCRAPSETTHTYAPWSWVPSGLFDVVVHPFINEDVDDHVVSSMMLAACRSSLTAQNDRRRQGQRSMPPPSPHHRILQQPQDPVNVLLQEMLRLAKPGATVVLEGIFMSSWRKKGIYNGCANTKNTVEVSQLNKYWSTTAHRYGWAVDPASIRVAVVKNVAVENNNDNQNDDIRFDYLVVSMEKQVQERGMITNRMNDSSLRGIIW